MSHSVFKYRGSNSSPSETALNRAARDLGISVELLQAVIQVEASGRWYASDGSFIRRFEPHHLPKELQRAIGFSGTWRDSLKLATLTRRRMFMQAYARDQEAACYASSWGGFQIMGFNAERSGFKSALDMVQRFEENVDHQLKAAVTFIQTIGADGDLRAQDFYQFARKYNGSGQPEVYARKIRTAYARITGGGSPSVIRLGSRGAPVLELQKALATRGYAVEVDGYFGAETLDGVRAFQAAHKMVVDGVVGAKTWEKLRDTASYSPKPELEATESESLADKVKAVTGLSTAATGATTAILGDTPSDTVKVALIAAVVLLGVIAAGAYLYSNRSKAARLAEYRLSR